MADPFLGEIRMFGGNFAPRGWALCNGQLLSISQNTALFSLLGTNFGGDGRVTFGLPDLRGAAPMNYGSGPGLTPRVIGEVGGEVAVTLIAQTMPVHTHPYSGQGAQADAISPANNFAATNRNINAYASPNGAQTAAMAPQGVGTAGGNAPHNNLQPYLTITFIIALEGVFPSRQ